MLNDPMSNFLDSVKPAVVALPPKNRSYPASYPTVNGVGINASHTGRTTMHAHIQARPPLPMLQPQQPQNVQDRPYNGKYAIKDPVPPRVNPDFIHMHIDQQPQRQFLQPASSQPPVPYQSHMFQTPAAPVRSIAPALPTMEEVQRRQSGSQLNNMGNFRRVIATQYHLPSGF